MDSFDFHYFIVFDTYEDAMAMHDVLDKNNIENKISPAPLDLVDGVSCGVSLMIKPDVYNNLLILIKNNNYKYLKIVKAERSLNSHRDRYC